MMKDQIDELQQTAEVEEETASQRQEPARKVRKEVTRSIKRIDNAAQVLQVEHWDNQPVAVEELPAINKPFADSRYAAIEEPAKPEAITGDTAHYPLPEAMLPATVAISGVFDEATLVAAPQPNAQASTQEPEGAGQDQPELDSLFDFQELQPSIDEIEPYAADVDPLQPFYEDEPLVTEEALLRSTDLAEVVVLSKPETVFDDEVMDTFEQLLELVYGELAEIYTPELEQHAESAELIDNQVIFMNPETPEPIEPNAFEEFVASFPKPEVTRDLDTIVAEANEQTLEETLVQLSLYLAEVPPDAGNPPVIQKALRGLAELVSRSGDNVAEAEKVAITPELTLKLLTLLRVVGYDNPQEVLLAFVKEHDFEFLLSAIRHLYQLCDDDRKELLPMQAIITSSKSVEPLTARLGKAILSLTTRFKVPEVAISD